MTQKAYKKKFSVAEYNAVRVYNARGEKVAEHVMKTRCPLLYICKHKGKHRSSLLSQCIDAGMSEKEFVEHVLANKPAVKKPKKVRRPAVKKPKKVRRPNRKILDNLSRYKQGTPVETKGFGLGELSRPWEGKGAGPAYVHVDGREILIAEGFFKVVSGGRLPSPGKDEKPTKEGDVDTAGNIAPDCKPAPECPGSDGTIKAMEFNGVKVYNGRGTEIGGILFRAGGSALRYIQKHDGKHRAELRDQCLESGMSPEEFERVVLGYGK